MIPKSDDSYVKRGETDRFVEKDRFVNRFCFELGSKDGIDYMKVDVTDDAWIINVW